MMQMGGCCHNDRIKPESQQIVVVAHGLTAQESGDTRRLGLVRVRHCHQFRAGQFGEHAGVIGSHDANAGDTNAKGTLLGRSRITSHFSPLVHEVRLGSYHANAHQSEAGWHRNGVPAFKNCIGVLPPCPPALPKAERIKAWV